MLQRSHSRKLTVVASFLGMAILLIGGCQRSIRSTISGAPTAAQMAELWVKPDANRDLFWGIGGKRLAPDPAGRYTVIEIKRGGYSRGYTVTGPGDAKREWSAKFPPEASTEVIASRLFWAVGYHQPPVYYLAEWNAEKAPSPNPQLPARFREKDPDLNGLKSDTFWSYYENPFINTRQFKGMLVLHAMLGNSDLKDDQNALYTLEKPLDGASRWYVARDLGQTFGRTGLLDPPRGDADVFEQTPFIRGVANGKVRFEYRGRHKALFDDVAPADVRWICSNLAALSDRQLDDAFRAGGYPKSLADRFIKRLKQKIAEGRALKD
jgi:hypothetical protein